MDPRPDELIYFYNELLDIQRMLLGAIGALVICIFLAFGIWIITGLLSRWRARLIEPRTRTEATETDIWRTSAERVVPVDEDDDE